MQKNATNATKSTIEKIIRFGVSPLLYAAALLMILCIGYYVVSVYNVNFDTTQGNINSLSPSTLRLLDDIEGDIDIMAFYPDASQRQIRILFDKYTRAADNLHVDFIDPLKNPVVAENYNVTEPRTVVFEMAGRTTRITPAEQGNYIDEPLVSLALFRLTNDQEFKVYFTTGHGELDINETGRQGLSMLKSHLERQNYLVNVVNLLTEGAVPDDCTVLIVAGPEVPFTDEEEEIVRDYLDEEGRIMVLVDPGINPNLDAVLSLYGIALGNDYIYETSSRRTTEMGGPTFPLVSPADSTEITANLPNQSFLFPFVRSVRKYPTLNEIRSWRLLESSSNSWAETDLKSAKLAETNLRPSRDDGEMQGPVPVAQITERRFLLPTREQTADNVHYWVRSAFFGNSNFVMNPFAGQFQSNINLFSNTLNWITRNEKIFEVQPNVQKFTPIELSRAQRKTFVTVSLFVFPPLILLAGIIVWIRRR